MPKTSDEIRQGYRDRLLLPELPPEGEPVEFRTRSGTVIAKGYVRVVIGDRGPYVEFADDHVVQGALEVPTDQLWRMDKNWSFKCFYQEHRSKDDYKVKVYHQRRTVDYADYRIGMWYISPFDLTTDQWSVLVESSEKK